MTEYIELRGCRENNLKNISINIPKRQITIFTGVSGSGKSSLVFETIGKEAQRQLNSTFSAFVQNFLPKYSETKVDYIANLSTPILIDQKRIPQRNYFSFNDIHGMCPECQGIGKKTIVDLNQILDQSKSLKEGAITLSGFGVGTWHWSLFAESGFFVQRKR